LASQPPADSPAAPASAAAALAWLGRCRKEARKNNIKGITIIIFICICICWPAGWLAVWLAGQLLARWWAASKQQKLFILRAQLFHFLC